MDQPRALIVIANSSTLNEVQAAYLGDRTVQHLFVYVDSSKLLGAHTSGS